MADPLVLGIVGVYLAAMLGIGFYASRRIRKNEDFMVAGRRLGPFMMAGTLAATEVGGGSSMGVAEKAYGEWGMSAGWYVLTMTITFLVLAVIAPRLRAAMVKTVPEYFRRRYGEPNGLVTAVVMLLPLVGLTAIQLIASSVVLSAMTGLGYSLCVVIVVVVVTIYSVLGGLWSVTLTDVVQWCLIVGGLIVAIPFAVSAAGGMDAVMEHVPDEKMSLTGGIGFGTIASLVVMYVASFAVGQEAVQRYYAARDGKAARWGSIYAGLVYIVFAFVPAFLGVIAYSMAQSGALDASLIEAQGERYVLPVLALQTMPSWLVGIIFAALISATLSSADSDLLAAGSIFSNDIYGRIIRPHAPDREILLVTRITMVVIAGAAMAVALTETRSMIAILMFSFSLRAGGAFIPYVCGHFWARAGWLGALGALVSGSVVVVLGEREVISLGMDPVVAGLLVSATAYVVLSLVWPNPRGTTALQGAEDEP